MPRTNSKVVADKICFVNNTRSKCLALALYDTILDEDLNEVEFLLKHQHANPNYLLPEYGITPLHCAVGTGCEDHAYKVVSFLMFYGGDPNVRCSEGTTPVIIAALWGRLLILKLLLVHRGNPFLTDEDGFCALDYAKQKRHFNIVNYLKDWSKCSQFKVLISSPSCCRNDAVTQTSVVSDPDVLSEASSDVASDDYLSCDSISESVRSTRETSCAIVLMDSMPLSNYSHNSSLCREAGNRLDRGFIYDPESDLLSDIDSNIDLKHTLSIYCSDNDIINRSNSLSSRTDLNLDVKDVQVNEVIPFDNNETVISDSVVSCCSLLNPADVAFVGQLPDEGDKPIEEFYTDDEAGIVLLKRNYPPDSSDSDKSIDLRKTKRTNESQCSTESYDTDNLTNKLKECKIFSGPVTKTTKKVYARKLKRFIKSGCVGENGNVCGIVNALSRTFSENFLKLIEEWSSLEIQLSEDFLKNSMKYKFRGGIAKCFFNYLLMDPSITDNLPQKVNRMHRLDIWKTFIEAIFYVGKGKQSRPYAHLYEALKPNTRRPLSKKVTKVLNIWNNKQGVVCLMIFHNTISAEALTREAAMIDALTGQSNLTNAQGGKYHGIVSTWNTRQKCQLGVVLLHRALSIYLAEGERQISPPDLEVRATFR